MMQQVVGIGTVATHGETRHEIVVLVFLLHLVITHQHLGIYAGRVGAWLALLEKGHGIGLLFLALEVGEETEFVILFIQIDIIQLTGNLLTATGHQGGAHLAIILKREDYGLVGPVCGQGVFYTDVQRLLGAHGHGHTERKCEKKILHDVLVFVQK